MLTEAFAALSVAPEPTRSAVSVAEIVVSALISPLTLSLIAMPTPTESGPVVSAEIVVSPKIVKAMGFDMVLPWGGVNFSA